MFRQLTFGRHFFGVLSDPEPDPGAPAGGGSAVAEPSYELPASVPRGGDPQPPVPPVQPPAAPPAPAGGTPPAPAGGAPAGQPSDEQIPRYRLDEVVSDRDNLRTLVLEQQRQISQLLQRFGQTPGPAAPAAPPPPQLTPQDIAIRDRLYGIIPGLDKLADLLPFLERRDAIFGAADAVPAWRSAEDQYWDRYANDSVSSIADEFAKFQLGEGKAAKDLNPIVLDSIRAAFTRWVTSDPARAARYEREDPSIPKEFWGVYRATVFDPIRRSQQAAVLENQPPALPRGGGGAPAGSNTPPSAPPAPAGDDEDAIHARAWGIRDTVAPR